MKEEGPEPLLFRFSSGSRRRWVSRGSGRQEWGQAQER